MQEALAMENLLSHRIIGAAIEVHKILGGPGLLESVYEEALVWELQEQGMQIERQKYLPITYKGQQLATPLKLDILVDNLVIIERKATAEYSTIFETQLLTYLRITQLKPGLVINFGDKFVRNGIHRVINYP